MNWIIVTEDLLLQAEVQALNSKKKLVLQNYPNISYHMTLWSSSLQVVQECLTCYKYGFPTKIYANDSRNWQMTQETGS